MQKKNYSRKNIVKYNLRYVAKSNKLFVISNNYNSYRYAKTYIIQVLQKFKEDI